MIADWLNITEHLGQENNSDIVLPRLSWKLETKINILRYFSTKKQFSKKGGIDGTWKSTYQDYVSTIKFFFAENYDEIS